MRNTWCDPSYGEYSSLITAEFACTTHSNCQAVRDGSCDGSGTFQLCPKTTLFTASSSGSCIYDKGKKPSNESIHI